MVIKSPLIIVFEAEGKVITHLHGSETCNTHEGYGLLICDIVRHVAKNFNVSEDDVWEWVDKERHQPTTLIDRVQ